MKIDPANAEAWDLLAAASSQLGLEKDAIRAYENTLKLRPDDPLALYNLGALESHQGQFQDAVRYFQMLHSLQPKDTDVLLQLAHCLFSLGRNEEARAAVNQFLESSRNDAETNLKAGELLMAHGEVQAALKPLADALQRADSDEARSMLAMAESRAGHSERVIELLEHHPITNPTLYASLLGPALNAEKRFAEAVPLLEEAIRQQGDEKPLYLQLAAACAGLSESKEAVETLQKAHSRWPDDIQIRLALARQEFAARDPLGALVVLREVPESALSTEELGMLMQGYAAIDRLEEARRYGELAAHREDVPERTLIGLANVYQIVGRDPDAVALLEKHRAQFVGSARYLFTLAFSYYNRGNYSASNDLLSDVIARDPKLAQAFYLKGSCLSSLGMLDEALPRYEAAARLVPNNSLYHFQLGLVLSMLRQKDRAEAELQRSIELNAGHAPAHYELAKIYFDSSRDDLARQQLEDAIKADPDFSSSFYLLSQVYMRMGRRAEANRMMKQFQQMQQKQRDEERAMKESAMKEKAVSGPKP